MTLLNVQYDLKVKSIIKYKILSYNRDFRVLSKGAVFIGPSCRCSTLEESKEASILL